MVFQDQLLCRTRGHGDMHNLTEKIAEVLTQARIQIGLAHVFCMGSTAAVGTIEYEPGLRRDLPELLDRLIPPSTEYGHEQTWHDGNGHSHLQATWLGPSLSVPVRGGRLVLGTWQQIFLLECDTRPRDRTLVVTVYGE
jgi:secondary thiamine-phosphate synthase enzyme